MFLCNISIYELTAVHRHTVHGVTFHLVKPNPHFLHAGDDLSYRPRAAGELFCKQPASAVSRHGRLSRAVAHSAATAVETPRPPTGGST